MNIRGSEPHAAPGAGRAAGGMGGALHLSVLPHAQREQRAGREVPDHDRPAERQHRGRDREDPSEAGRHHRKRRFQRRQPRRHAQQLKQARPTT